MGASGMSFRLVAPMGVIEVRTRLTGKVNLYNLLAASGAAAARGLSLDQIAEGAASLAYVPGRFQTVDAGQPFTVVVDYAHTDDALRNLTALAREFVAGTRPRDYLVRLRRRSRPGQAAEDGARGRRGQRFRGAHLGQSAQRGPGSDSAGCFAGAAGDGNEIRGGSRSGSGDSHWPSNPRDRGTLS